jgi:hypothetical protein
MKKTMLILGMLLSLTGFGRKIYVSSSIGNDSRTIGQAQNPETPWATLSKVQSSLSSLGANDSILFKRGDRFGGTFSMSNRNNMYFGAYGTGSNPLFWGTGSTITSLFTIATCSNNTFENLTVSDTTISPTDRTVQAKIQRVFIMRISSNNNKVIGCVMDRIGYGLYLTPTSNGNTVQSCDIGNLRMIKNTPTTVNGDDDYGGVPIQISSRNNQILGNFFHDCYSVSYDYRFDGGGIEFFEEGDTVSGNMIMYNTFYDNNGTLEHGSSNDGIPNNPIQNNTFAYNKVINCEGLVYVNNRGQYKTTVKNLMLYNNVVVEAGVPRLGVGRLLSMATTDTISNVVNLRNTIFKISNGFAVAKSSVFAGTQLTHTNNMYQLGSGSVINYTLEPSEILTQSQIWTNTSSSNPLSWNYSLIAGSQAINSGINVGIARDFNNVIVSNPPDMGILEFGGVVPVQCSFTFGAWSACVGNAQTRSYTTSPSGCVGTPPADSTVRPCNVVCSFQYSSWSACFDGVQTRTFTSSPSGCVGAPPADSLSRTCTPPTCNYTLTTISTRQASCLNRFDGSVRVQVACGNPSYTYTLRNSSTGAVIKVITTTSNVQSFTFLSPGSYRIDVVDSNKKTAFTTFRITSVRRRNC